MERRKALRIALVIASISTAFLPWIGFSIGDFPINISLIEMMIELGEAELYEYWVISGAVYLLGSVLLLVRDEAPYLQMIGLLLLPMTFLMDSGGLGAGNALDLLRTLSGWGLGIAHVTAIVATAVFARPRRVLALIERLLPLRSWLYTMQAPRYRCEDVDDAPPRRCDRAAIALRPAVRRAEASAPRYDGIPARPRPMAATREDAWWSDGADDAPCGATPEVPCIRLPPPRARNAPSVVRQDGGRHDR